MDWSNYFGNSIPQVTGIADATPYGYKNILNSYWPTTTSEIKLVQDPEFQMKIRKVENGYVLKVDSREFVFENIDSLLEKLKEQLNV